VPGAFHVVVWTTAALDTIRRGTRNQLRRDSKTDQAKRSKETEADSTHPYPDDHNKATRAETVGAQSSINCDLSFMQSVMFVL
jgi:transposase